VERPERFIVPPPGLIPERPPAPKGRRPEVRPDTKESFPAFFQNPLGLVKAAPAPAQHRTPAAQAGWAIELPDGRSIAIEVPTVLGRNPSSSGAAPVSLVDPAKSLSKTHALLEPLPDALRLTDLHSTNGVAIISTTGRIDIAEPGIPLDLTEECTLQLGQLGVRIVRR
jgi:FHA domain